MTINDVQLWAANPGRSFTIYTISAAGNDGSGNQQFKFLTGTTFITTGAGAEDFPTSIPVQTGDLLAFSGNGPVYGVSGSDATYETPSDATYVATPPTVGDTYSFATNGTSTASYEYVPILNHTQQDARTYSIGVDVSVPEPCGFGFLSMALVGLSTRRRSRP